MINLNPILPGFGITAIIEKTGNQNSLSFKIEIAGIGFIERLGENCSPSWRIWRSNGESLGLLNDLIEDIGSSLSQ
jgi:hypothetical protein